MRFSDFSKTLQHFHSKVMTSKYHFYRLFGKFGKTICFLGIFTDFFKIIGKNSYNFLDFLKKLVKMHTFLLEYTKKSEKRMHFYQIFQKIQKFVCIFIDFWKIRKMYVFTICFKNLVG